MTVLRTRKFQKKLLSFLVYTSKDKISASKTFQVLLDDKINNIINFPYKYRQSIYFKNKEIQDMVFQKYTITYEIYLEKKSIFNKNKPI